MLRLSEIKLAGRRWVALAGATLLLAGCGAPPPPPDPEGHPPPPPVPPGVSEPAQPHGQRPGPGNKPDGPMANRPDRPDRRGPGRDGRSNREGREHMMYMRQRLNRLASLPEKDLNAALAKWPPYQAMDKEERAGLKARIKHLQTKRRHTALNYAEKEGIDVPIKKEEQFVDNYWKLRLSLDQGVYKQMRRLREQADTKLKKELVDKYGEKPTGPQKKKDGDKPKKKDDK